MWLVALNSLCDVGHLSDSRQILTGITVAVCCFYKLRGFVEKYQGEVHVSGMYDSTIIMM